MAAPAKPRSTVVVTGAPVTLGVLIVVSLPAQSASALLAHYHAAGQGANTGASRESTSSTAAGTAVFPGSSFAGCTSGEPNTATP